MFLERNLYPNKMLMNVNILIPPSTGIQGGGQQGAFGGPWGCPNRDWTLKRIMQIKRANIFLFILLQT